MTHFYMRLFAILTGGLFLFPIQESYGQVISDSLALDEITVTATRIGQPQKLQPVHVDVIDSTRLSFATNKTIGSVLAMESGLFVKSNGPGSFSNASQRGLSPEQIQVLWEGIPINHAMLGLTDLSLLPSDFFSSVQVSSGVPSSAFGGGLSGGLYLNSDFSSNSRLSLSQSAGSFGQYHSGLQASVQDGAWNVALRSEYVEAENDYNFFNRALQRVEERQHNSQQQKQIMASAGYQKGSREYKSVVWFSESDNNIPGSILATNSGARQDDQSLRWLSTFSADIGKARITAKNYLDRVVLDYFDERSEVQSQSTTRRWIASGEIRYPIAQWMKLKGELSGGITGVETNNYTKLQLRQQASALLNPELSLMGHRLKLYPALRLDSYSDFGTVLSPSLGWNYELIDEQLYLRGQLSRDFNPPTFNALYWAQGGNPNLSAERSKSAEAGAVVTLSKNWLHRLNVTGFYNRVHNGIRWYPDDAGTYTPSNIEEISSKGIELSAESRFNLDDFLKIKLKQTGALTRTEITEPRFAGDAAVGNQMRYVPQWSYKSSLELKRDFVTALFNYQWVGRRFVTDTETISNSLEPYGKMDATLQARQHWLGLQFTGNLQINNILNEDYEVIQWYAMPRRNLQFTLTATYTF